MSDSKSEPGSLELLANCLTELAREIGGMDLDNPQWQHRIKELSQLTEFRETLKTAKNKSLSQRMDELIREVASLKLGDRRRAQIVNEMLRLSSSVQ